MVHRLGPNQPLQPSHTAVTPLACATGAPTGGRLNGSVRQQHDAVRRRVCQWKT